MNRAEHLVAPATPLDRLDRPTSIHRESVLARIGSRLQAFYGDLAREAIPQCFARLLDRLDRRAAKGD